MRNLYADVCRYAHSAPGFTNAEIWSSNGPVFVGRGFTQFWLDYCDTLIVCYVLLKLGYPPLTLPKAMKGVSGQRRAVMGMGSAPRAMAQVYFPLTVLSAVRSYGFALNRRLPDRTRSHP